MFDDYEENEFPLAYLITFRTYGTWLHGDERKSTRRYRKGKNETKIVEVNVPLKERMEEEMATAPVVLDRSQRKAVQDAIKEVCKHRDHYLHAVNVRSNHAHSVIGAQSKPERIADALKAYSTRRLR